MKELKLVLLIILFSTQVFPLSDTTKSVSDSITILKSKSHLSYFIREIKIIGNEITEDEIILREMSIKKGSEIRDEDLQFDENRIMSLGLFSDVKLFLTPFEDQHQLIIYVKEAWYIWPIPILEIHDKDWSKLSFGLGLSVMNFRGKNESLLFAGAVGHDPWIIMSYKNPWFERTLNLQLYIEFLYQKRRNKSLLSLDKDVNFDQKVIQPKIILGKRFGLFQELNLLLSYNYLEVPFYLEGRTASKTTVDRNLDFGIGYKYDSRNLILYPSNGFLMNLAYVKKGLGESVVNYHIFESDLRAHFSLSALTFNFRNLTRMTFGNFVPNYAHSFLGYSERIRGYYNNLFEGENASLGSLELRYPFVQNWIVDFDFPVIPKNLQTFNFLFDVHIFSDAGFVWNNKDNLLAQKIYKGFGLGISACILPYRSFRFDIAFNEKLDTQFIFDLSLAF